MNFLQLFIVTILLVPNAYAKTPKVVRVACVGDSITEGPVIGSYPSFLQKKLGPKYVVKNFGAGKRTVLRKGDFPYWEMPQFKKALRFSPSVVIINFGLNDTKPQNWQYGSEFIKDYSALIRKFKTLKSRPKVFIAIPTPLVLPERFGLNQYILEHEIIPHIEKIARRKHVPLIDLHAIFEGRSDLQPDFIHPNETGMKLIAQKVYRNIIRGKKF